MYYNANYIIVRAGKSVISVKTRTAYEPFYQVWIT